MIYDKNNLKATHITKVIALVGVPYKFRERLKNKDLRSSKITVGEVSQGLENYFTSELNTVIIEIRPNGIVIHLDANFSDYAWCIPFYRLSIYKSNFLSIHAEGNFLKLDLESVYPKNKKVIDQLIGRNNTNDNESYYG